MPPALLDGFFPNSGFITKFASASSPQCSPRRAGGSYSAGADSSVLLEAAVFSCLYGLLVFCYYYLAYK